MKVSVNNKIVTSNNQQTNINNCERTIFLLLKDGTPVVKAIIDGNYTLSAPDGDVKFDPDLNVLTITSNLSQPTQDQSSGGCNLSQPTQDQSSGG
jgi:hypothetical protein